MGRIREIRASRFVREIFFPLSATLALLLGMNGCSRPPTATVDLSQLYWVLSQEDLNFIQTTDPQIATSMLDGPSTFVLTGSSTIAQKPLPHGAVPTILFTSYSAFASSLQDNAIHSLVRAVAYDPEYWAATPREEQQQPFRYMQLFAQEAQRSGYQTILVPGRDLALTPAGQCAKQERETINTAYLRCGMARAAQYAPFFEIQCAPMELDISELRSFVAASARQAHEANPSAVLTATLSTTPNNATASSADLVRAAQAILPFVQGFQLNMTRSTRMTAIDFLRSISGTS